MVGRSGGFKFQTAKYDSRRRNQRGKVTCATNWANGTHIQPSDGAEDVGQPYEVSGSCKLAETESEAVVLSLPNQIKQPEQHLVKKEEVVSLQRKPSIQDQKGADRSSKEKTKAVPTSLASVLVIKPSPNSPQKTAKATSLPNSSIITSSKPNVQTPAASKPTEKATLLLVLPMSRPLSAPIVPGPRPTASVVSTVQTTPSLARSVIAASRLGPDPSPSTTHLYVPQSYRNVIVGNSVSASLVVNSSPSFSQPPTFVSTPLYLSHSSERVDPNSIRPSFTRGVLNHDAIQNGSQWMECPPVHRRSHDHFLTEFPATSACPTESVLVDEFPHLDIINDLLEDEHGVVKAGRASPGFGSFNNGPHYLDRQFSLPGDIGMLSDVGPLTGSCRFERMQSYHDYGCLRSGYGSSGGPFELLQANQPPYVNGQIDGLMTNQWQMGCMRHNTEGDGYPYRRYPDLACGVNGTIFWPSNGH